MNEIKVLDLFSGIGGFALGLKRASPRFRTVAYCEIDPYCQKVLQARMLDGTLDTAPICTDITKLDGKPWARRVDLVCGGFPCQDISNAGKKAGIEGGRSSLWTQMYRIISEIQPRFVFVENVAALLVRGIERVLGDLAQSGYDAEWDVIPACAIGALHIRERVWILAYPTNNWSGWREQQQEGGESSGEMANAYKTRWSVVQGGTAIPELLGLGALSSSGWWDAEPNVGRVADGVPKRMDRVGALGNSVVPQVVEWIGRRIVKVESDRG